MAKRPRVLLRPAARADLGAIWRYGAAKWSIEAADHYVEALSKAFELIASFPEAMPLREELEPPVRAYPVRSHLIIYRSLESEVEVIRIRHGREDWKISSG